MVEWLGTNRPAVDVPGWDCCRDDIRGSARDRFRSSGRTGRCLGSNTVAPARGTAPAAPRQADTASIASNRRAETASGRTMRFFQTAERFSAFDQVANSPGVIRPIPHPGEPYFPGFGKSQDRYSPATTSLQMPCQLVSSRNGTVFGRDCFEYLFARPKMTLAIGRLCQNRSPYFSSRPDFHVGMPTRSWRPPKMPQSA